MHCCALPLLYSTVHCTFTRMHPDGLGGPGMETVLCIWKLSVLKLNYIYFLSLMFPSRGCRVHPENVAFCRHPHLPPTYLADDLQGRLKPWNALRHSGCVAAAVWQAGMFSSGRQPYVLVWPLPPPLPPPFYLPPLLPNSLILVMLCKCCEHAAMMINLYIYLLDY